MYGNSTKIGFPFLALKMKGGNDKCGQPLGAEWPWPPGSKELNSVNNLNELGRRQKKKKKKKQDISLICVSAGQGAVEKGSLPCRQDTCWLTGQSARGNAMGKQLRSMQTCSLSWN